MESQAIESPPTFCTHQTAPTLLTGSHHVLSLEPTKNHALNEVEAVLLIRFSSLECASCFFLDISSPRRPQLDMISAVLENVLWRVVCVLLGLSFWYHLKLHALDALAVFLDQLEARQYLHALDALAIFLYVLGTNLKLDCFFMS